MFDRALKLLAYAGGAVVLALMLLTLYDIVMRAAFSRPFLGAFELTEILMGLIVALGLPYCAATGGHVVIDVFAPVLDRLRWRWLNVLIHVTGAALMAVIAWRTVLYALASVERDEATNMLKIPFAPFQLVLAASAALFAIVLAQAAVRALRAAR